MTRLRRSGAGIGILAGLMMFSGIALADTHKEDDTLLVVGYDAMNGILVTGISNVLSGAWDCAVPELEPEEQFEVTYGYADDVKSDGIGQIKC